MANLDYDQAKSDLRLLFEQAEGDYLSGAPPEASQTLRDAAAELFSSNTQSYREVLIGCALARLQSNEVDIRKPYINQGAGAFSGRTLDEQVVNPFLQDRRVPSSKGPYLAVFRRNVSLTTDTRSGLRDKTAYDAMLVVLDAFERAESDDELRRLTRFLLYHFVALRDAATIPLSQIGRLSVGQIERLVADLLKVSSGGLIPVLLTVALLETIKDRLARTWDVEFQGINVADRATGAGGDVTISDAGRILLSIEVTERPVDRSRVVSTFNTKIVEGGLKDYLFVYTLQQPDDGALDAATTYFAQGHEINFVQLGPWTTAILAALGSEGRETYLHRLLRALESAPAKVKVAWNDVVRSIVAV